MEQTRQSRISESANMSIAITALAWEIVNTKQRYYPDNLEEFLLVFKALNYICELGKGQNLDVKGIMAEFHKYDEDKKNTKELKS